MDSTILTNILLSESLLRSFIHTVFSSSLCSAITESANDFGNIFLSFFLEDCVLTNEIHWNTTATPRMMSEMKILKALLVNQGSVLSRNQLLEKLFDDGESFIDDNTLSVYIKRLRDKLGDDAEWIETVRGIGYKFRKKGV